MAGSAVRSETMTARKHSWREWVLLILAAINGLSGVDGHKPEHYVAGAVFFAAYCVIRALSPKDQSNGLSVGGGG